MEQTKTIKTENGELYVQGDVIIGRMEVDGNVTKWHKGDKLHREGDLPAHIERNDAGAVKCEAYYRDGKEHREGGLPAHIVRNKAGAVKCEAYYRDGKEHRDGDLPASIERNDAGVVTLEVYYRDGKRHRDGDRPAHIERNDAGVVTFECYCRDDVVYTPNFSASLAAERAKNAELQAQLDQLKQKIKAILE